MTDTLKELQSKSNEITDLESILALLQWDQETYMPKSAVKDRAEQIETLSAVIHSKSTSQELGDLLKEAEKEQREYDDTEKALVRVMRRAYDKESKLPEEFVKEFSKLTSMAINEWAIARSENDFDRFQPYLSSIVEMTIQQANYYGFDEHPYDALLDIYEEGFTTRQVKNVFKRIKGPIIDILNQTPYREITALEISPPMSIQEQENFSKKVLEMIGYDFDKGREDVTAHPFTQGISNADVRLTNRYNHNDISFIFTALHEGGHGLYEQRTSDELARTHLNTGVSLGIHESQSRLWENIIGRTKEFWEFTYPKLQSAFPEQFNKFPIDDFVRKINAVHPSLIRVEADEVTYNLHILIRFELELAMIEGKLDTKDLPDAWREKYNEYLGVKVDSEANGVLQDIHWAMGGIGYFPTYTLGNLNSAQIWENYKKYDPNYKETIKTGDFHKILEWLTEKIYQHGAVYTPNRLMEMVTGETLNPKYFLDYLSSKFLQPNL